MWHPGVFDGGTDHRSRRDASELVNSAPHSCPSSREVLASIGRRARTAWLILPNACAPPPSRLRLLSFPRQEAERGFEVPAAQPARFSFSFPALSPWERSP